MRRPRATTIETAPWTYEGHVSGKDFLTAARLTSCFVAAALPERYWPAASRLMARTHLRMRQGVIPLLERAGASIGRDARSLAHEALAADYLSNIGAIREILPGGWKRETPLIGRDVLDRALEQSKGAVLWCSPFVGSDLSSKKALALAGYPLTQLSAPSHPFSATRVGALLLNPVRLRAVNRYLVRRVLVVYGQSRPALDVLRQVLLDNGVVTITATGAGRNSSSFPFMGGTTELAIGAPLLARQTGAALIPVFTLAQPTGGYRVELGPEIDAYPELSEREAMHRMAARYIELLEPVVRAHPAEWEAWFHPGTWHPAPSG